MIKTGVLQPNAKPLGVGISGAMIGLVDIGGVNYRCIVKPCTEAELAAECFCALLAKTMLLNAPEPVIVQKGSEIWFGSVNAGHPNIAAHFKLDPTVPDTEPRKALLLKIVAMQLSDWANCGRLLAFDILIANADRHLGNLLFDGKDYSLIDHARSLGLYSGPQRLVDFLSARVDGHRMANLKAAATAAGLTFGANGPILCNTELQTNTHTQAYGLTFQNWVEPRRVGIGTLVGQSI